MQKGTEAKRGGTLDQPFNSQVRCRQYQPSHHLTAVPHRGMRTGSRKGRTSGRLLQGSAPAGRKSQDQSSAGGEGGCPTEQSEGEAAPLHEIRDVLLLLEPAHVHEPLRQHEPEQRHVHLQAPPGTPPHAPRQRHNREHVSDTHVSALSNSRADPCSACTEDTSTSLTSAIRLSVTHASQCADPRRLQLRAASQPWR